MAGNQPPLQNPKLPTPVPLEQADPARREEYKDFVTQLGGEGTVIPTAATTTEPPPEDLVPLGDGRGLVFVDGRFTEVRQIGPLKLNGPTDEEKKAFVRCLLGNKQYQKTYNLFGAVEAVFEDRGVEQTERMYAELNQAREAGTINITDEASVVYWTGKFLAATTLKQLRGTDGATLLGAPSADDNLYAKVQRLTTLSRPLYHAVMDASTDFEQHVEQLIQVARDPGFWQAGGAGSR